VTDRHSSNGVLDRLAELARQIESHKAAVFLLELERADLQAGLRDTDWTPPPLPEKRR
jgi:hypothetical protein